MTAALLVAACVAILADAYLTRLGLHTGYGEDNAAREWLIDVLGEDFGTWGVAAVVCSVLMASYAMASSSPLAGISYATAFCAYTYVAYNNYQRVRR